MCSLFESSTSARWKSGIEMAIFDRNDRLSTYSQLFDSCSWKPIVFLSQLYQAVIYDVRTLRLHKTGRESRASLTELTRA